MRSGIRLLAVVVLAFMLRFAAVATAESATLVVLVRHAEKVGADPDQDPDPDPDLILEGRRRALSLAAMLADVDLDAVYSTDFNRTRETARPTAFAQGLPVTLYDAGELEAFASKLRAAGGRVLVVGHSNSTAELVRLLGGEPGEPIREDEYDRLYFVVLGAGEPVTTLIRYSP